MWRIGDIVYEDFTVTNENSERVLNLTNSDFTKHLYDPDGAEINTTNPIIITELGHGHYRASYSPDKVGQWYMAIYHSVYFPWGKTGTISVSSYNVDSIAGILLRVVGLTQENYAIDGLVHDMNGNMTSSTIKLYSDSSDVGSGNNIIAEYNISATYVDKLLDSYKVVKL